MERQFEANHKFYQQKEAVKCGCYVKNKADLGIKSERNIIMPLKHIDYDIEIVNGLVDINIKQKYKNPTQQFLQVEYCFPMLPKSCIYKFVATFEDKRIEGIVKQKEQAKKEYQKAVKQGRQAVYAQINEKSIDIMNMEIGNIPPNQQLTIEISIMQELELVQNTFYKLYVPATITPRYAHKLYESNKKSEKQQAWGEFTWAFKINLRTNKKVIFSQSATHSIQKINENQAKTESLFVLSKQCPPIKDLTFIYATEDAHLPSYTLGRTDASSTAVLSFIPKFCELSMDDAYKAAKQSKSMECDLKSSRGQYIFLIDRSGSMYGQRIQKAKEALILFLKSLPQDCYFNIYSFGSTYKALFTSSKSYDAQNIKFAIQEVQKMSNDMGGTQIYQPFQQILNDKVIDGYPKQIFLLTDGGVSDTQKVVQLVRKKVKFSRVHGIGIGNGASTALIQGCAEKGKGKHVLISQQQNVSEKIIQVLNECLSPVISEIDLIFDKQIVESILPNPKSIPYILKNDKVNFYVTFKGQLVSDTQFQLSYVDSRNKQKYSSKIKVNAQAESFAVADKMAIYKRIKTLQNIVKDGLSAQNQLFIGDAILFKNIDKSFVTNESIKHQILSEYTAFLCIGKKLVDGQFQQFSNIGISQVKIQQKKEEIIELYRNTSLASFSGQDRFRTLTKCSAQLESIQDYSSRRQSVKLCYALPNKQKSSGCMGNPFQGVGDSMKAAISKPFKSQKKQESIESRKQEIKSSIPMKKQTKQQIKQQKQRVIIQSINKSELKDAKSIVNMQNIDGSWTCYELFDKLSIQNKKLIEELCSKYRKDIILTYLVVSWIEKNSKGKQYMLILKKAKQWLKQEVNKQGYEKESIQQQIKMIC